MSTATKAKALTALGTLAAVAVVGALLYPHSGGPKDPTDVHSTNVAVGAPLSPVVRMALDADQGRRGRTRSTGRTRRGPSPTRFATCPAPPAA